MTSFPSVRFFTCKVGDGPGEHPSYMVVITIKQIDAWSAFTSQPALQSQHTSQPLIIIKYYAAAGLNWQGWDEKIQTCKMLSWGSGAPL